MRVVLFCRKPRPGQNFSIELIVEGLIAALAGQHTMEKAVSRFESNGVFRRIYNAVEAAFRQGDINHVTGDVNFLTLLMNPRRTVLTIHDCGRITGRLNLRKRAIRQLWFRAPSRRCAAITVVSHQVKAELLEHIDVEPSKVHVIPSFVPTRYVRSDRPFRADRPVILQVGTAANKNLLRLCEALVGVPCRLCIVGRLTAAQKQKLSECRIEYEQFEAVPTERMVSLYEQCDLVAFVSTFEGFGMPIVESNLVGRPVVTSRVTSMPEVAADAACLVDPYDVSSIRAGILRVIDDAPYRNGLVERGFVNAERFKPSVIAQQYEVLYRATLERAAL